MKSSKDALCDKLIEIYNKRSRVMDFITMHENKGGYWQNEIDSLHALVAQLDGELEPLEAEWEAERARVMAIVQRLEKSIEGDPEIIPAIVAEAGEDAAEQYREFLGAIGNLSTRKAYRYQLDRFLRWAKDRGLSLESIHAFDVAVFVNELERSLKKGSVIAYRSTIGRLFGRLKDSGVIAVNPFERGLPIAKVTAESRAALEWQAAVDAAAVQS